MLVLVPATAFTQDVGSRGWQQRLQAEVPLPVPSVALDATNPFAASLDSAPELVGSVAPHKISVTGIATAAAYVDSRGECLGAVPLELPFPGLTSALVEELSTARFEPARSGSTAKPAWTIIAITITGKVKQSTVLDQSFELPDPSQPPEPTVPPPVAPSGNLLNLPATPIAELTAPATARRLRVKVTGRETDVAIEALVHITADGRCDRFVALDLPAGLEEWLSAYLASWRLQPALVDGQPADAWVVYSARVRIELSSLESTTFRTVDDATYDPNQMVSD
jgi:hypothetical protein